MRKWIIIGSVLLGLLLAYGLMRLIMYRYIQPDEIGIWMQNGGKHGIEDYQVWTGHFPVDFNPLTKSFILPGQPWTIDLPAETVYSKENGEWTIDPSITFSVDRAQATKVCHKYNGYVSGDSKDDREKFMVSVGNYILIPLVKNVFVETLGSNRDTFMMAEKMVVAKVIEDSVRAIAYRHGFIVNNFVTGITPPKAILETNRAKNNALQSVYKAKADVEQANAQAAVKIATARADAEAMLVTERANTEAIRMRQQVLNELMIKQMWIEKWDGVLPQYSNGNFMMVSPTAQK